ncbi:MAG: RNA polymerase sigma factor [Gammaproteobacteria bacterium]|nr:RNA polymerase sigma factor [Gammaproteobacteria bacterium]MYF29325.1 RNA polymerase sigma factor [Gammaproteobacteria bacterium]MYK46567.1 RNA polymerase sigma factor [Gammaproteobacteria bacterium]
MRGKQVAQQVATVIVQGSERLVENPQRRRPNQQPGERHPPLLSRRQRVAQLVPGRAQSDAYERGGEGLVICACIGNAGEPAQILDGRHAPADAGPVADVDAVGGSIDRTGIRFVETHQATQQRALAAAVGSPDLDPIAWPYHERQLAEQHAVADAATDGFGNEQVVLHCGSRSSSWLGTPNGLPATPTAVNANRRFRVYSVEEPKPTPGPRLSDPALDIPGQLLARARDNDDAALADLIDATAPQVRRWALVQTGDATEADDLTQEVLIRMIRNLDALPAPPRLAGWLYTVTRNAAADRFRQRARQRHAGDSERTLAAMVSDTASPASDAERGELGELLQASFHDLPRRQREVFDLVELQGIPATQAAEILGIRATSVRGNLFKARRNLRRRILAVWPDVQEEDWQ